nr:uncharacterized protein c18b11.03c [Quercus suber]
MQVLRPAANQGTAQIREDITLALQRCANKLDVLRAVVLDAYTEHPHIGVLPTIDVRDHLTFHNITADGSPSVQRQLEHEQNEPHRDCHARPQWRVSVCLPTTPAPTSTGYTFRLAWATSHNLADGMSGLAFHSIFLQALREVRGSPDTVKPSPILPPLDLAAKMPVSWKFLLAPILTYYLPFMARWLGLSSAGEGTTWFGADARPPQPTPPDLLRTNVRTMSVCHEIVEEVSVRCRTEHVRITGLLSLLASRSLAQTLQKRGQAYNRVLVDVALNMRRALKLGHGCIANYPSGATDAYSVQLLSDGTLPRLSTEDWAAARNTTEHLYKASNTLSDQPIALLAYLTDIRPWVVSQVKKRAEASLELSNLGIFVGPQESKEGDWQITDVVFSQSADAMRPPLSLNACSSKQGPLNVVATWWPGMLGVTDEETFVEEILASIKEQMIDLVKV